MGAFNQQMAKIYRLRLKKDGVMNPYFAEVIKNDHGDWVESSETFRNFRGVLEKIELGSYQHKVGSNTEDKHTVKIHLRDEMGLNIIQANLNTVTQSFLNTVATDYKAGDPEFPFGAEITISVWQKGDYAGSAFRFNGVERTEWHTKWGDWCRNPFNWIQFYQKLIIPKQTSFEASKGMDNPTGEGFQATGPSELDKIMGEQTQNENEPVSADDDLPF